MKTAQLKHLLTGAGGTEIAEAALVLPITFMLLLGIYWFGRALNTYETINHAALEATRAAAAHTCATCTNANLTPDQIATYVQQALQASGLDPTQAAPIPPSDETIISCADGTQYAPVNPDAGYPQINIYYNAQLLPTSRVQACGISVSFQYPYQFYLPFTSSVNPVWLKTRVQMRVEE
jgi:Flp pilus assembly protein TadG